MGLLSRLARRIQAPTPRSGRDFGVRAADDEMQLNLFGGVDAPPTVHHGTYEQFAPEEIAPWSHVGTEGAARARLRDMAGDKRPDRILPFELAGKRVHIGAEPDAKFSWADNTIDQRHIADRLLSGRHITREEYDWVTEAASGAAMRDRMTEVLRRHEISALGYTNAVEDVGSTSYMVPEPNKWMRPTFPVFSAAGALGGGGLLSLAQRRQNAGA